MASENELVIKISGNVDDYKAALQLAAEQTEGLSAGLEKVSKYAAIAFAALSVEVYASVKSFHEHVIATEEVNNALQNQGIYTDALAEKYRNISKVISEKIGVDDDQVASALASGQALLGNKEITEKLTLAVANFATAHKIGLAEAFNVVGKGVAGNTAMLQRYGIHVEGAVTSTERLALITEKLGQKYDGVAEVQANAAGSTQRLKIAFDDVQKAIGEKLAPTFDKIVKALEEFFRYVEKSPELINFISIITLAGAAMAGLTTALTLGAQAFLTIRTAMIAAGLAAEATSVGIRLAAGATGIGLLLVAAGELYIHWNTWFPAMKEVFNTFATFVSSQAKGLATALHGILTLNPAEVKKGLGEVVDAYKAAYNNIKNIKMGAEQFGPAKPAGFQDSGKAKAAKEEQDIQDRADRLALQKKQAQRELLTLQDQNATKDSIELKKQEIQLLTELEDQKNKAIFGSLQKRLDETRRAEVAQARIENEQNRALNDELLAHNEAYQAMSAEQKEAFRKKEAANLKQDLVVQSNLLQTAAKQELALEKKSHDTFLLEQRKYGTAYATINQAMHSAIYQGTKTAFGELEQMQQSSNSTLKAIGKTAAIANIIIKTAESAMAIFAGFSTIPIVGPALGVAGAAAAVAFGAEQVGRVTSAASGGLLEGGIPGRDSIPVLAMAGEVVVPRQNFEEVIGSTAAARAAQDSPLAGGAGDPMAIALLSSINEKLDNVRGGNQVTINGDALGDPVWVQQLVQKLSDALEFKHARIVGINV